MLEETQGKLNWWHFKHTKGYVNALDVTNL
jgi:hypothetical protein